MIPEAKIALRYVSFLFSSTVNSSFITYPSMSFEAAYGAPPMEAKERTIQINERASDFLKSAERRKKNRNARKATIRAIMSNILMREKL